MSDYPNEELTHPDDLPQPDDLSDPIQEFRNSWRFKVYSPPARSKFMKLNEDSTESQHWLAWLTVEESVELIALQLHKRASHNYRIRMRADRLRQRALHRRRRQSPEFRVYQQGMR